MNENINIAEILKDAPKETELWSPIVGLCLIVIVLFFLFEGRTTTDKIFPYIHVEYPIRAVVVIALGLFVP